MRRALTVHYGLNYERTVPVYLDVDPEVFNNVAYGGEDLYADVDVGSENQEWDATSNDWWILVMSENSPGDDTVTLRVAANSTGSPRQGTVTFSSNDCDDVVVTVNQLANPT